MDRKLLLAIAVVGILLASGCTVPGWQAVPQTGYQNDSQPQASPPSFQWPWQTARASISQTYHTQIDPILPGYLLRKKGDCAGHNGDWYDIDGRVGCFNIRIPWDSTLCMSAEITVLRNVCASIPGAVWTCDQNNAGCYYPY